MRLIPWRRKHDEALDAIEASVAERMAVAKREAAKTAAMRPAVARTAGDSARLSQQNSISSLITKVIVQREGH